MKRHLKQVHKIKPCEFFESFSRFPIKEKTEEERANTLENQENLSNENVDFDPSTAENDDEVQDENQEDLSKNEQCQETVVLDQAWIKHTVWKCHDSSDIQIFREINFGGF